MNKLLISIVGPTAIGKTTLAIALANHYGTEIISADSRQFFKEMTIGTAVPDQLELAAAKHHFIQHKSVTEPYCVGDFEKEALALLDILFKEKDIVIMVGGSGLYVDAVTVGLNEFPKTNPKIREELTLELTEFGIEQLQEKLKRLDNIHYHKVDLNNPHRLIRALEICIGTGKPYSSFLGKAKKQRNFDTLSIGLEAERQQIYDRINRRVDIMMSKGLLKEARSLQHQKHLNALQTVGYKELFNHFNGTWDYETAVAEIKKNTRRFAKRQLTWFRKNESIFWLDANEVWEKKLQRITKILEERRYE